MSGLWVVWDLPAKQVAFVSKDRDDAELDLARLVPQRLNGADELFVAYVDLDPKAKKEKKGKKK